MEVVFSDVIEGEVEAIAILDAQAYAETVSEQTTGGQIWPAARALVRHLQSRPVSGRVLELGSGTGWLGIALACRARGSDEIVLSEYALGLEWLERNVALNRARFRCPVSVVECDWQWFAPGASDADCARAAQFARDARWDVVVGSDLVYNDAGVVGLPRCIAAIAQACPRCTILYAHTLHRFDNCDVEFFAHLHRAGLVYRELFGEGEGRGGGPDGERAGARPDSPPPFAELFPEQRQAVFEIARDAARLGGPPENRHGVVGG